MVTLDTLNEKIEKFVQMEKEPAKDSKGNLEDTLVKLNLALSEGTEEAKLQFIKDMNKESAELRLKQDVRLVVVTIAKTVSLVASMCDKNQAAMEKLNDILDTKVLPAKEEFAVGSTPVVSLSLNFKI